MKSIVEMKLAAREYAYDCLGKAGLLALLVLATPGIGRALNESTYVRVDADNSGWRIGNSLVERHVRFDRAVGLHSVRWKSKLTGTDFLERARASNQWGNEFSFSVDDSPLAGAVNSARDPSMPAIPEDRVAFDLIGSVSRKIERSGELLEIRLRAKTLPVNVVVFYSVYEGHPVIRKWVAISNRGAHAITLSHVVFESVHLAAGAPDVTEVDGFYGIQPREIFFTGRAEDPAVVERNANTGEGFIIMNEAPGSLKRTETGSWGRGDVKVMYDTDLFPFERTLDPGETFTTAKSSIAFFQDDQGFADPHWVMPSYTSEIIKRTGAAWQPLWIYNTWEPFHHDIDAKNMAESAPIAGRLGLDVFDLDEGWEKEFGDNAVNSERFPLGLDPLRLALAARSVRLGLDQPLAVVDANTTTYREHPEWQATYANGRPKISRHTFPIMCLASAYRDIAARRISDLISRNNLRFVQLDLTTLTDSYGMEPGCSAHGHDHRSVGESLVRQYESIQYIMNYLHQVHPDVVLDLTFESWGNYKHGIDYAHIAEADLNYLSNVDDSEPGSAGPIQARTIIYQRSLAIPTENMDVGNLMVDSKPLAERFATMIAASPIMNGDLRKLTLEEQEWWAQKISWYKTLRLAVPMNEGFFPLGAWRQPNAMAWDGFAKLSRRGEGVLAVFKNQTKLESVQVKLPAFPTGRYSLRSVITNAKPTIVTDAQLHRGVDIPLAKSDTVEVLEVRRL
jgi:alpha-galactosidase